MLVIPAIDLRGGRCVRLLQGDPDKETVYSDNPVEVAKKFEGAGASLIHVVDLDGAFTGYPVNHQIVEKIAKSVSIPIEIGGGIRRAENIQYYLDAGIKRIIVGTAIINDEFDKTAGRFKDCLIAGIDARNSHVAVRGWKDVTSLHAHKVIEEVLNLGIREIIYTDISTDGMLLGPNIEIMESLLQHFPNLSLIASGGVSSIEDIVALSKLSSLGLKGCIVGKAIYDGRIDLARAIAIV